MKKNSPSPESQDPYEKASILSRIFFFWVNPIIKIVGKRTFMMDDHYNLSDKLDVGKTIPKFEAEFQKKKSFWWTFFTSIDGKYKLIFINTIYTFCEISNVILLYFLTEYLKDIKDGIQIFDKQKLALIFGLMIFSNLLLNALENIYDFLLYRELVKIKNNYTLLLIKHILNINMHSNSETSKGNLVNLIQVDCASIEHSGHELVLFTYIAFQFVFGFAIGFYFLGKVFVSYICVSLSFVFLAIYLLNVCMKIDKNFMLERDDRLSFVSSIISNVRFVKFNVLENYFAKIVYNFREKEIRLLWKYNLVYACTMFFDWIASGIAKIVFLAVYFATYSTMTLKVYVAFLNLDFMLGSTFSSLPWIFLALFRIKLAFHRMQQFFKIQPYYSNIIIEPEEDSTNKSIDKNDQNIKEIKPAPKSELSFDQNSNREKVQFPKLNDYPSTMKSEEQNQIAIKINNVNFSYFNPEIEEFEDLMEEDSDSSSEEEGEEEPQNTDETEIYESELHKDDEAKNHQQFDEGWFDEEANEPTYKLSKGHLALRKINLNIKKGEMVFIIGNIGSGKSSFLYSLIGELNQIFSDNIINRHTKGEEFIKIKGSITICPQKPFILTKTIRENILFYEDEDGERLARAVSMAFLEEDFGSFEGGLDKLLIENGMNISGGQRSRINLARCFYRDSDIYLLDSPFTALDIETSRKIMEETLMKTLSGKTRLVVTHNIQFLKYADRIILLKKGKICFSGSFPEFEGTQFYMNYKKVIKFQQPFDSLVVKADVPMRKKTKTKPHIEIADRTLSTIKLSHPLIAISEEEREYFKGFLNEDRAEGRQLKRMFSLIFKYYGGILPLLAIFAVCVAGNYMLYFASLYLYDIIEQNRTHGSQFWEEIRFYIFLNVTPAAMNFLRMVLLMAISIRTSRILHHRMIFEVLHADLCLFHDKIEPGRIISRFSSDYDSVDFYIFSYIEEVIVFFAFLSFEIYITKEATSIYMIAIFIVYYSAIFYYQGLYIKGCKDLYRLERIGNAPIVNLTNQIIEGSLVIKVFKKQRKIIGELEFFVNQNSKNTLGIAALYGWFHTRLAFINIFVIQFMAFAYILIFTNKETLNAKTLEIFISLIYVMIYDSREFMENFTYVETETINLERCDALLHIPLEKRYLNLAKERRMMSNLSRVTPNSLLPVKIYSDENITYSYTQINEYNFNKNFLNRGHVKFESIFAKYPLTSDYILKEISFELMPGEKLGIIGKTGSGKSTILKILLQYLTPEKGKILVDDYDISKIDAKKLRSEFLAISQEITLFEGTLRDNLIFENLFHKNEDLKQNQKAPNNQQQKINNPLTEPLFEVQDANNGEMSEEMEQEIIAKLTEFGFSKLKLQKKGLDLHITNDGGNLSIGEQQLISFFKAFFTKKKILLLDEATAPFDYVTQQKLIDYFNLKIKGKTVISVAHKITAIADFDKILVMDNGCAVEYGFIKDLVKNENSYLKRLIAQYIKF